MRPLRRGGRRLGPAQDGARLRGRKLIRANSVQQIGVFVHEELRAGLGMQVLGLGELRPRRLRRAHAEGVGVMLRDARLVELIVDLRGVVYRPTEERVHSRKCEIVKRSGALNTSTFL